jgi:DNA uptake protein ComE-like DNA-binding protein
VPKEFDVSSVVFQDFGLNSRVFDVTLKGKYAGKDDPDTIELEDKQTAEDLSVIRYILSKLPAAYGNDTPVAFTLMLDDKGDVIVPLSPLAQSTVDVLININTAAPAKLTDLPGVGPATADLIVAKRPFKTVDDLQTVDRIGPAKMRDIKPLITV